MSAPENGNRPRGLVIPLLIGGFNVCFYIFYIRRCRNDASYLHTTGDGFTDQKGFRIDPNHYNETQKSNYYSLPPDEVFPVSTSLKTGGTGSENENIVLERGWRRQRDFIVCLHCIAVVVRRHRVKEKQSARAGITALGTNSNQNETY